jgi:Mg2+/Co2+ transporter CorB|tara:strand:+ start:44 stop:1342 length:1299 start_codon:yes stop_codon:yes gene_type:complete
MEYFGFGLGFWITVISIFILLILSGFFSGSETALTAASRSKLQAKADKGSAGAARALKVTDDPERLIGSVLLGNNFVNILATSLITALFTKMIGENGVVLATLVMTFLILVFAEVLPKTYAITNPESAAIKASRIISIIVFLFAPIVSFVRLLVRGVLWLFGIVTDPDTNVLAVKDEIAGALTLGHKEGIVEKEDRDRILGALDLADRTVEEIMLHRSEIEMIDVSLTADEILTKCLASSHTRLPLYSENPENIVGVIHAKDLARATMKLTRSAEKQTKTLSHFKVLDVAMEPYFVPETTPLDDQMRQFLKRHTHFALVVDEYGALQGLITLEDILEEIVGEITDEFDNEDTALTAAHDGHITVDGGVTIRDLNRAQEWNLPNEEANTLAGLVIHEAQMIPSEGQVFVFYGFRFEVVAKKENRITRLKISRL